jgi:hypothetical protein
MPELTPTEAGVPDGQDARQRSAFREGLETLINSNSMEGGSDTPDFILADFLSGCLVAFDSAVSHRTRWYAPLPDDNQPSN